MKTENIFFRIAKGKPFHIDFRTYFQFDIEGNPLKEKAASMESHETVVRISRSELYGPVEIQFYQPSLSNIHGVSPEALDLDLVLPKMNLLDAGVFYMAEPCDANPDEANEVTSRLIEIVGDCHGVAEIEIFSIWLEPETFKAGIKYETVDGESIVIRFMDWAEIDVAE